MRALWMNPQFLAAAVAAAVATVAGCALRSSTSVPPPTPPPGPIVGTLPPKPILRDGEPSPYTGSEACRTCHAKEFAAHRASPHSHTLRRVANETDGPAFRTRQRLRDPRRGVEYGFTMGAEGPAFLVEDLGAGVQREVKPEYVLGSGRHGRTFLADEGGRLVECRASYFPERAHWDWTPGQGGAGTDGQVCFPCHSTVVAVTGSRLNPGRSMLNVGCERCHGPGSGHIASVKAGRGAGPIFSYAGAPGALLVQMCGECHRSPSDAGSSGTDENVARFAARALARSNCFRQSGGTLSCVNCHDAHGPVSRIESDYARACLSCHGTGTKEQKACPVNPRTGCVGCHMPKQEVGIGPDIRFHNHWIRVYRGSKTGTPGR